VFSLIVMIASSDIGYFPWKAELLAPQSIFLEWKRLNTHSRNYPENCFASSNASYLSRW
jgi:hypothetical protein